MRILVVHYRYFVSGGPERYLFNVKRLLEERGHEVIPFSVAFSRNEPSEWSSYFVPPIAGGDEVYFGQHTWTPRTALRALQAEFYSPEVYRALSRLVQETRPDVALVLQYLRKMSPAVLPALRDAGVPIVQRLSDFSLVCPQAHLTREGAPCTECVGRLPLPSVRHGCVRGSRATSLVELAATAYHRSAGFFRMVDRIVAPASYTAETMRRGGWPAEKLRVIPTPVPIADEAPDTVRDTFVYVGRIDPSKGLDTLVDAYGEFTASRADAPGLVLVGPADGDAAQALRERVARRGLTDRVVFAGEQDANGVAVWLSRAIASVVPSIVCENLPNSLLESLAAGAPVIASDQPSLREALEGSDAGIFVPVGDAHALAGAMAEMIADREAPVRMSEAARRRARERFSGEAHVTALLDLFAEVRR